jgi:hypothetical protein
MMIIEFILFKGLFKNCLCISTFYFMCLIQPLYSIYLIHRVRCVCWLIIMYFVRFFFFFSFFFFLQTIIDWQPIRTDEIWTRSGPLLIMSFVCVICQNIVHLSNMFVGCWLISQTEKRLVDTRWMLVNHRLF